MFRSQIDGIGNPGSKKDLNGWQLRKHIFLDDNNRIIMTLLVGDEGIFSFCFGLQDGASRGGAKGLGASTEPPSSFTL